MRYLINKIIFIYGLITYVHCDVPATNITDLSKCKVYYSRSESTYKSFFQITNKYRQNSSLMFDFHFSVLAPSDAHILLARSEKLQRSEPVYEIVLGAGQNSFSDIRRTEKGLAKATARTKNLLSRLDPRTFWIHISKDGLIEVGREHEELAFLSFRDPSPIAVRVFSFSTWPGIDAKWFYDCPKEDGNSTTSEEIKKPLSDMQRLKKDMLDKYDPYVRPILNSEDLTFIDIQFTYERINLDTIKSKMSIQGTMILEWKDEKINWNPGSYGNITNLHFFYRELWQPNIIIFNSASGPGTNFLKSTLLQVYSSGSVKWKAYVDNLDVWCDAATAGDSHWPADEHTCEILFGFLAHQDQYVLHTKLFQKVAHSNWLVLDASAGLYTVDTETIFSNEFYQRIYSMKFQLKRITDGYTAIYFTPLFAIAVSMLVTFCLSPVGFCRISLCCFQIILITFVFLSLASNISTYSGVTPHIVLIYSYGIFASLFSLAVSIFITNLTRVPQKKPVPQFLLKIITSYYLKYFINFNIKKNSDSYDNLVSENSSNNSINLDKQETWIMLSRTIDRILFIIYCIGICITIFKHY